MLGALDAHHSRAIRRRLTNPNTNPNPDPDPNPNPTPNHPRAIRRRFTVEAASTSEGAVACADVARFGRPFWLLAGCCVVVYGCVLPFNNVASALLQARAIPTRTRTRACAYACARPRPPTPYP